MFELRLLAVPALAVLASGQDFTRDVSPVLAKRCQACHGSAMQMAGLRLDDPAALSEKKLVVPGDPDKSPLVARITSDKKGVMMPPAGPRLAANEVAAIRSWIEQGAKVPEATAAAKPARSTHWAFQPVKRVAVPPVKGSEWARNPIDGFVLARLEAAGVQPSPEAGKTALLRRVTFDLTGLPPTPAEMDTFLKDTRPDAYERVVDRLLASPHYGERWARQWLDLARYADSDGYEKDLVRPWAWRYRNWVIDALNADMPYDQFTLEQMAGDLIPNATVEQRVATGFHRNVLTNREAGVDREEARFEQNVNRTNTITTVWLGLTAGCAQCHNHKYDPLSQREFYSLFAYVANLEESDIDAPLPGEAGPWLKARPEFEKQRAAILAEHGIPELQQKYEARLKQAVNNPGADLEWDFQVTEFKAGFDNAVKTLAVPVGKRNRRQSERMTARFLRIIGPEFNKDKAVVEQIKAAREKLAKLEATLPRYTEAITIREDGTPPRTYLAVGGDYKTKGDAVNAGVPTVIAGGTQPKNRLELAGWLTSKDNPLTARVAVNRMWGEFFGRALVRTGDDFGLQGEKPSNPELLDWLASEYMDSGWRAKHLHRLIVTSATYRQSSKARPEIQAKDPENLLLSRQNRLRLSAEGVRDAALASSGLMNSALGGPSIRPPQPAGIAELGYANSVKWVESQGPDRYRRGLYIHFQRTTPYPMLMNFDAPDSNVSCTRRNRTNTPLQALNLLNDPVFVEAAQGLAARVLTEAPGDRIEYAFQLALGRKPAPRERERLATYLDQQRAIFTRDPKPASELMPYAPEGVTATDAAVWTAAARVLLNLDEFINRE